MQHGFGVVSAHSCMECLAVFFGLNAGMRNDTGCILQFHGFAGAFGEVQVCVTANASGQATESAARKMMVAKKLSDREPRRQSITSSGHIDFRNACGHAKILMRDEQSSVLKKCKMERLR